MPAPLRPALSTEDVWWSESEYREAIRRAAPQVTDAQFVEYTADLVARGLLRREQRSGVKGYAFVRLGVEVTAMRRGH